uniref:Bestrophin homolog n=1 Tax=Plectus sambesii TaxID=2011161 RepID=A0A914WQ31_9BILA
MTVLYTDVVSRSTTWNFAKLLLRWKGSLWKVIWAELVLWLLIYTLVSLMYRLLLNCDQREQFENFVKFWSQYTGESFVPLTFILGFFVSLVVDRWWSMYQCMGSTETVATLVASYIEGSDEETITVKRNIIRYMVLTQAMMYLKISFGVRKCYPNLEALRNAGLINEIELKTMEETDSPNSKHWMPIYWSMSLIKQAKRDGKIESDSDSFVVDLYARLREYKNNLSNVNSYMCVPIPLAYTQVVFLAVRLYFLIALFANQYLNFNNTVGGVDLCPRNLTATSSSSSSNKAPEFEVRFGVDLFFPFATVVQFFFYVGWVKVAESLFNPFGGDDDDFEVVELLAKNLQNGLLIVDGAFNKTPAQIRDPYSKTGSDAPFPPTKHRSFLDVPITAIKRGVNRIQDTAVNQFHEVKNSRHLSLHPSQPKLTTEIS